MKSLLTFDKALFSGIPLPRPWAFAAMMALICGVAGGALLTVAVQFLLQSS